MVVAIGLSLFAGSTILSWGLYGTRCAEYLFGSKVIKPYQILFCIVVVMGAVMDLSLAWDISDTLNACMAIPNLIGLLLLSPVVIKLAKEQIPNFAGIKFTNPDLALYQTTLNYDKNVDIPWGVDEWFTGALSVGAKGAVGSSFNFAPALYQSLIKAFEEGDVETAKDCQWKSVQMINILASKGYMGCAKALMGWLGVDLGPARLPQGNPTADQLKELRSELEAIGFFQWAMN